MVQNLQNNAFSSFCESNGIIHQYSVFLIRHNKMECVERLTWIVNSKRKSNVGRC